MSESTSGAAAQPELAAAIERIVRRAGSGVSFVDIRQGLAGQFDIDGTFDLCLPGRANTVIWVGMSASFCDTLWALIQAGVIEPVSTTPMVYYFDGETPSYPIAKALRSKDYTKPHWLPVVFKVGIGAPLHEQLATASIRG